MEHLTEQEMFENQAKYDLIFREANLIRRINDVIINDNTGNPTHFYEIGDLVVRQQGTRNNKWFKFDANMHTDSIPVLAMKDGWQLGVVMSNVPKLLDQDEYPLCAIMVAGAINWKRRAEKNVNNASALSRTALYDEGYQLGEIYFHSAYQ